ncbi:hypothetical protein TWF970_003714 [Orbilia oligospora]|uniref:Alcohol dehydrogenase-like N-terminal domain-containing protein n=1 Tax=Orbilia oligospora TaxID=2813651 RepID=A0A7C8VXC2_ORBOL|nr:hypothetical protein TWF970_003714 [Orbilia oligospora]
MMKALVIEKTDGKPGQVYYPLKQVDLPKPSIRPGEVLVKILAAALNHREVFIRQHLYPGINFETPLGADGVGIVVETSSPDLEHQWKGKKVILTPGRGWESSEDGPEGKYAIVGGTVGVSHGEFNSFSKPVQSRFKDGTSATRLVRIDDLIETTVLSGD